MRELKRYQTFYGIRSTTAACQMQLHFKSVGIFVTNVVTKRARFHVPGTEVRHFAGEQESVHFIRIVPKLTN